MRRSDRAVTQLEEILSWLQEAQVMRLGFSGEDGPYIVPLSFGVGSQEPLVFYFHGAKEGKKLDLMRANPRVCFEVDLCDPLVDGGDVACGWGQSYRSMIGWGTLEEVTSPVDIQQGLDSLMAHYAGPRSWAWNKEMMASVAVLRLTVSHYTAKKRGSPGQP